MEQLSTGERVAVERLNGGASQAESAAPLPVLRRTVARPSGFAHTAARLSRVASSIVAWLPTAIIALAALTLLWTRLIGLGQSMFDDELYSVIHYITPGPAAIFGGHYVPNDHALFELLSWVTVHLTGIRSNAGYRFWGVMPAIAAVVIMTWWLRKRRGEWVAAAFAVLAVSAPGHLTYGTQARGYGLCFLAGVLLMIGAVTFKEQRSARALVLVVMASLIGIWTLPVFGVLVLAVLLPLLWFWNVRRPLLIALVVVGAASLLFYAPMLSRLISQSGQHFGKQLRWDGFIRGPLVDQVVPNLQLLFPNASARVLEVIAGSILGIGFIGLWRRWERMLALTLLGGPVITYLVLEVARFYVEPRFASFVLLPMLVVAAAGIVEIGWLIARVPRGGLVAVLAAALLSVLLLSKIERMGAAYASVPQENTQEAATILASTGLSEPIVTNSLRPIGFAYYLGVSHYRVLRPVALARMFCSKRAAFIYLEHGLESPRPSTSCLRRRHAVRVIVPQRAHAILAIWFVPARPKARTGSPLTSSLARFGG